jgi:hypothetical protein
MDRCPLCRAAFREGPLCYRCGADLSLLLTVEVQAEALERQAVGCLAQDDSERAVEAIGQALSLRRSPMAMALLGFAESVAGGQGGRGDSDAVGVPSPTDCRALDIGS